MNNRQLTIFRTVCEEGSMTKTAEKLYMTQPAVSQTIKELEQESGVCFLERYNRKVVPTESGRLLYQYACHILGLYQDLEQHLKETEGVRTIRIGANLSVGVKMLRGFIRAFEKKYPDIQVKVTVKNASDRSGIDGRSAWRDRLYPGAVCKGPDTDRCGTGSSTGGEGACQI